MLSFASLFYISLLRQRVLSLNKAFDKAVHRIRIIDIGIMPCTGYDLQGVPATPLPSLAVLRYFANSIRLAPKD